MTKSMARSELATTADPIDTTAADLIEPIFIVGCQRSGTTLLGSMIGGHPQVITIPEAQFVVDLLPDGDPASTLDLRAAIDRIAEHPRFKVWGFSLEGRRPQPPQDRGTFADAMRWLVRDYAPRRERPGARFWVDHQPGHGHSLARLNRHFPRLKAIHVVRDGRAVAASVLPLDWGPNAIHSAAYFWEQRLAWCLAAAEFLGHDRMLLMRYEDIVREPEASMRRVADFIGLPYHPDMVLGRGLDLPAFTVKQHRLVGSMPNPDRIDDWMRRLSKRQIEIFEAITGDLLAYFHYPLLSGPRPRPVTRFEKIWLTLRGQAFSAVNDWRFKRRLHQAAEQATRQHSVSEQGSAS